MVIELLAVILELAPTLQGITVLGQSPPVIQSITTFSAGLSVASRQADVARALLALMAALHAGVTKSQQGMETA